MLWQNKVNFIASRIYFNNFYFLHGSSASYRTKFPIITHKLYKTYENKIRIQTHMYKGVNETFSEINAKLETGLN
jgi:hypothetical protein